MLIAFVVCLSACGENKDADGVKEFLERDMPVKVAKPEQSSSQTQETSIATETSAQSPTEPLTQRPTDEEGWGTDIIKP